MLFADRSLARRIDSAEAALVSDFARAATARRPGDCHLIVPVDTGVAVVAGRGSPVNKMVGVGFDGPLDEQALAAVEDEHLRHGVPLRAEIATLVDPSVCAMLTNRGYQLLGFENVLGLPLEGHIGRIEHQKPSGLVITEVGPAGTREWLETIAAGFAHPDSHSAGVVEEPAPGDVPDGIFQDFAAASGFTRYIAAMDSVAAGAASMRLTAGIAMLSGASTLPAWRRRGIQSALLAARLERARNTGCDLVVITTEPGSRSQQNAQRQGFGLLYSRAVLVKAAS